MIAVYGVDPSIDNIWYVYDYFDNVYENDIKRFASLETLKTFLSKEHFRDIRIKKVEKVNHRRIGNDVFNDPFLSKNHSSQLANISNKEYQTGLEKIKTKIKENAETEFRTSVVFYLISAIK
jgi:hypothetical protein